MKDYEKFLLTKRTLAEPVGIDVPAKALNAMLFPFQRDIVRWALWRGRAAIFADCGLGKTPMQLEWAHQLIVRKKCRRVLILAPLAVAEQTRREGRKFVGIELKRSYYDTACKNLKYAASHAVELFTSSTHPDGGTKRQTKRADSSGRSFDPSLF